jgi:hypothetical protein
VLSGWEDDLPSDDSLTRQFVLGNVARYAHLLDAVGARRVDADGAVLFDFGSPVVFDNAMVLTRPPIDGVHPLVEEAKGFFDAARPWVLLSVWPLPDLSPTGLHLMGHPPMMFRPAGPPPAQARTVVDGFEILTVDDTEAMRQFAETIEDAFPMPGAPASPWASPRIFGPTLRGYLGVLDGEPVATSAAFVHGGVVDVEMVSCLASCRGRGIGEAMTWAATLADRDAPAVLLASDDGQPVYERMGYLRLTRITLWFWPGDADS